MSFTSCGKWVPKFRVPHRLVSWMQENGVRDRIPSAEGIFFKRGLSNPGWACVQYARQVGKLPPEMEAHVLLSPVACVEYAGLLMRETPDTFLDACAAGGPSCLVKLAGKLHGRIPERLEVFIDTPSDYRSYVCETRIRVPEMEERILFSGRFPAEEVAVQVGAMMESLSMGYGMKENEAAADPRLKKLLEGSPLAVENYMGVVSRKGLKLDRELWHVFKGRGKQLLKLAEHLRQRLPSELEDSWEDAQSLLQYTVRWVRNKLPAHLEDVLMGDHKAAVEYAFQVVRGFSSPRLGDNLHTFLMMKSFEFPEDQNIRRYLAECERVG